MPADLSPRKTFRSPANWRAWLAKNHASSTGLWVQFAKKGTGVKSITYPEALEAALCFGWIDGKVRRLDDVYYLQWFTPRRRDSMWSARNRDAALALIERGLMEPAGLEAIERAKANGRWDTAYVGPSRAEVPPDLAAALELKPKAARFFATLKGRNRYAILFRLQTCRKPETRASRLREFVEMLERGETIY